MTIESFILIGGFIVQIFTLFLGYLKLLRPQIDLLKKMSDSLILSQERDSVDRKINEKILRDLDKLGQFHNNRNNLCSWTNGNADRLTAKVSMETLHLLKPLLDDIRLDIRK